ncbi:MAG: enoyl-CoA hydratase [Deltaproteobacteria bacterium]|nr:enoyl-CoA hydratase [Deltaproteobacteria bacterium]
MSDLQVTTEDGVTTITFTRPARKNALTVQMYQDTVAALKAAASDPAVRVVVITGSGDSFTSGNDVADFMNTPPTGEDSPVFQFLLTLFGYEKPVVVAVNGTAVGIGVTMLLHADIVYVADSAKLKLPFTTLGLCAEGGSSFLLPRMAGHARAAELLLFGEPFDAATAVDVGLASRVVPAEGLAAFTKERARILARERPAVSLRTTKRLMKEALRERIDQALVKEAVEFTALLGGDEAREAFTAFFEKRKPDFAQFS